MRVVLTRDGLRTLATGYLGHLPHAYFGERVFSVPYRLAIECMTVRELRRIQITHCRFTVEKRT
jgi:hypothetical protein